MEDYNVIASKYHHDLVIPQGVWNIGYEKVLDLIKHKRKLKLLDVGCGPAHFTYDLGKITGAEVVGIDIAEKMLEIARKYHSAPNIQYQQSDILQWDQAENYYDCAISTFVCCVFSTKEELLKIFKGVYGSLKPFGEFILLLPNWDEGNGQNFFSWDFHYKPNLKDGDTIEVLLKGANKNLLVQDYFWAADTYINLLEQVGFKLEVFQNFYADKDDQLLETEKYYSPFYLIKVKKIVLPEDFEQ